MQISLATAPTGMPLTRFVQEVRVITPSPGAATYAVDHLPDGTTSLLFRLLAPGEGDVSVSGPRTRALYKIVPAIPLAIRVVFLPGGAYPFFGVPVGELADRVVRLDDVWGTGATALCDRLLAAPPSDRVPLLERALVDRLRRAPFEPASALVARAAARMLGGGPAASIAEVARGLGVSERHLRRTFHATVGIGPKRYARIVRFQRALALGRGSRRTWTDVAREVGYFDQAHLIADFRDLAAASPAGFQRHAEAQRVRCE